MTDAVSRVGEVVVCRECDREIEECWVCGSTECRDPACYRCVRQQLEAALDPVAGPAMPS